MKIIITESQYKKVIKSTIDEAVAYSVSKKYLKIERSSEAEERIKQVFTNLKSLPNSRQLDKRGWRISFPYTNDSTEDEIESILKRYQFTIKDYRNNLAIDIRSDKEIALNKALNIVSKKEPEVKELMDRYASIKSKGVIDKEDSLMIVFSSAKYDIVGMTTGRNWEKDSCMDLIKGGNKGYVKLDLKEGTIICYLTNINDTNLEKPIGRILIKPFINLENSEDVILYPDFKTYGNIPNSEKFIDNIDGYMEKTQKLSGSYRRLGCLYNDNERDEIEGKETIRTRALKKLKNGEDLTDPEFMSLPLMDKRKLIDKMIIDADILHDTQYSFASQSQKKKYISLLIKYNAFDRYNKFEWEEIFKKSTKESKKEIIDYKLRNGIRITPKEFEHASSTQKETYFERKLTIFEKLINTLLIDGTPKDSIKSVTYQYDIQGHELKFLSPVQKKRYMEIISKFN